MESDIIIEGFNQSEAMHGVRYAEFIGDGDSSVYKNILSYVSYGRSVRKIECANHVTKCYTSALYDITKQVREARPILSKARITRMKICVRKIIKHRAQERMATDGNKDDSARLLAMDAKNAAFHVLGHHEKCADYYCNVVNSGSSSAPAKLDIPTNVRVALIKAADIVCNKSRSLVVYDATSNLAENLMSQIAKTLGGKRVNHYQRRGYQNRCAAAALAFQKGPKMHLDVYKQKYQRSPTKILKKYVNASRRVQMTRDKNPAKRAGRYVRRSLVGTDKNYGPCCQTPDLDALDPKLYEQKTAAILDSLGKTAAERSQIRRETCDDRERWFEERRKRITATSFHEVANMRNSTSCTSTVNRLIYDFNRDIDTPALQFGRIHEELALQQYEKHINAKVTRPVGLIVHPDHPFLAATPDGIVNDDLIVEVKCPKRGETQTLKELASKTPDGKASNFFLDEHLRLKRSHPYYSQVQCQLACTRAKFCDFFVWTPKEVACERISADETFFLQKLDKVSAFYLECMVPELVDPRKSRSMAFRERSCYRAPEKQSSRKRKLDV